MTPSEFSDFHRAPLLDDHPELNGVTMCLEKGTNHNANLTDYMRARLRGNGSYTHHNRQFCS
jgi:hypothetical protein